MDISNSLSVELYFWGHFDVLQDSAGQFAQKGRVNYRSILEEKVEHCLRTALHQLPLHQSLKKAVSEWFYTAEFFSKPCHDWNRWNFPKEKEHKKKEYLLPVMHLCKLAIDAFDITTDGRLLTTQ